MNVPFLVIYIVDHRSNIITQGCAHFR